MLLLVFQSLVDKSPVDGGKPSRAFLGSPKIVFAQREPLRLERDPVQAGVADCPEDLGFVVVRGIKPLWRKLMIILRIVPNIFRAIPFETDIDYNAEIVMSISYDG